MTLRRHIAHCTFRGGLPCGSTRLHPALPSAPARCEQLARLWGTRLPPSLRCHLGPSALRPARAQCGAICEAALPLCSPLCPGPLALSCPLFARPLSPCPSPRPWLQGLQPPLSLSPSLRSPASSSLPPPPGQREHGAEQFARQPSLPAPPLCSCSLAQPCLLCVRSPSSSLAPLPRPLGPWPSVSLSPSSLYPSGMHIAQQYARHPSHSLFTLPPPGALVPGLVARSLHCTRLRPLSLYARPASPSLPCPFPSPAHAGYYAGHCVGKSHECRRHAPGPRCMTLRRTLHLWGWTALWQRAAAPRLFLCPRALRAARSVVGHLVASAPRSLFHAAVARPLPCPAISVPLPSGQRKHDAEQFARQRSLFSLPRPPGLVLPPVCSLSLVLPCPPSQVPWSLALCLSVPVLPLPPRHTLSGAIREGLLPLPLHLAAPWCPGPWACGTHIALHPPAAFVPLLPLCLPLPSLPFSLFTVRRSLRRTLCRQVASMSQARIWPLPPCPALFPLYSTQDTTQDTV